MIHIQAMGDQALLVNVEQRIEPAINQHVLHLYHAIEGMPGIRFCIPAYCSLTIGYDPGVWEKEKLERLLLEQASQPTPTDSPSESRIVRVPVCYEGAFAPDMETVEQISGCTRQEIIRLHTSTPFLVYMLGFIPGFAYMGILPEVLHCPRKTTPRLRVPTGSVGLAGAQTGIYPSEAPGGWQLIGRTPLAVFEEKREDSFLFHAGDQVRFHAISSAEFERMRE